jgi:hypothetical protein
MLYLKTSFQYRKCSDIDIEFIPISDIEEKKNFFLQI